ncbi:MAG: hypothetical protein WKF78_04570 [Candidatus Limnocylindrales bacterium]
MAVPESSSVAARPRWRFARWLAASGAAAAAGAIAGGLVEAAGLDGLEITLTAAGFFALVVLPILLAGSVLIRAIYLAWQPRALLSSLTEDGGGSPRFTAWLVIGVLAALGLAWSLFQGTWMLAAATAFRPNTVSFAEPAIALVTIVVIVALSRPAVQLVAAGLRRIDRAWRVRGHRTLLRPRDVLAAIAVLTLVVGYVLWRVLIKKRLGPFDISVILAPAVAIMVTALVHAVWRWAPRARLAVGGVAGALAATAIATRDRGDSQRRPSLTLEIWNARPIAGLAVDKLFDLDRIREHISLAQFRPVERPGAPHPDIVLVTIDTVRADHTPPYGGKAEMPVLRDLGARGSRVRLGVRAEQRDTAIDPVDGDRPPAEPDPRPRRRLGIARRSAPRAARRAPARRRLRDPPASCAARGSGGRRRRPASGAGSSTSRSSRTAARGWRRPRGRGCRRAPTDPATARCSCGCTSSSRTAGPSGMAPIRATTTSATGSTTAR